MSNLTSAIGTPISVIGTGGQNVLTTSFSTGSAYKNSSITSPQAGVVSTGGVWVAEIGTLVGKTASGETISIASASGYIPVALTAVSASSTVSGVVFFS
jgi:hypothetical protein